MNLNLKESAEALKLNLTALFYASKDERVPLLSKVIVGLIVAYALSPIDLIPDFIPVLGYLDDLIIIPIGIYFSLKLIPEEVWQDCQELARSRPVSTQKSYAAAVGIIIFWLLFVFLIYLAMN